MDSTDSRTKLRWIAMAVSALWISYTLYSEFFAVDPTQYGFKSPEIEQDMKSCTGDFQTRYKCKESLIIDKGHESFIIWMGKMGLIFGPPLALFGALRLMSRNPNDDDDDNNVGSGPPPPPSISSRRVR